MSSGREWADNPSLVIHRPVLEQYLLFLALSAVETLTFHLSARALANHAPSANMVSTALLISSCTSSPLSLEHSTNKKTGARLIPVFMVIWEYDIPEAAALVDWAVIVYNIEALRGG